MAIARNPAEVYAIYNESVHNAVQYVFEQVMVNYKKLIMDIVYSHDPEGYERTFEFLESWETSTKKTDKGAVGELRQNSSFMSYNPENFQHGSYYTSYGDVSDQLAGIIYGGLSGQLFGEGFWTSPRDAWSPLINELKGGKLKEWFIEGMQRQGIPCRSVGVGRNFGSFW